MIKEKELDMTFYEIQVTWTRVGMNCLKECRSRGKTTTTISGMVADQAALHGLLARVRDYGLVLISIKSA
jgi:hypothetical protein